MVFFLVFQFSCVTKERDEVVVNSNSRDLIIHSNTDISNEKAGEYFKKGLIYVEKEKFEKALPLFHKANKIEKNNVVILNAISNQNLD